MGDAWQPEWYNRKHRYRSIFPGRWLIQQAVSFYLFMFAVPSLYPTAMKVKVDQSCPTLCDPVHGIVQARIPEWVVFPLSRGSSQPKDQTQVSHIAGWFFTSWATWKPIDNTNIYFPSETKRGEVTYRHKQLLQGSFLSLLFQCLVSCLADIVLDFDLTFQDLKESTSFLCKTRG